MTLDISRNTKHGEDEALSEGTSPEQYPRCVLKDLEASENASQPGDAITTDTVLIEF